MEAVDLPQNFLQNEDVEEIIEVYLMKFFEVETLSRISCQAICRNKYIIRRSEL